MKKVLSVLLAAAMVMGMSVSAFAKNEVTFGAGDANTNLKNNTAADLTFSEVMHEGKLYNNVTDIAGLGAGDTLYFPVEMIGNHCNHNADKDWKIKVNNKMVYVWSLRTELIDYLFTSKPILILLEKHLLHIGYMVLNFLVILIP